MINSRQIYISMKMIDYKVNFRQLVLFGYCESKIPRVQQNYVICTVKVRYLTELCGRRLLSLDMVIVD